MTCNLRGKATWNFAREPGRARSVKYSGIPLKGLMRVYMRRALRFRFERTFPSGSDVSRQRSFLSLSLSFTRVLAVIVHTRRTNAKFTRAIL